ncbi:NHL repeat-containing protein [Variovorax atrisoli]|uniref:NHL repeat-containing protein n=1 Tax=Variovorax atrisoli TaxID=3394203 RepID=UPI0010EFDBD8|nr:NHL repeat-containing protein [Variovorax paradoxus]MDR6520948.1 sugar lactone lactonase YvrE [Variovorax paradoxus]
MTNRTYCRPLAAVGAAALLLLSACGGGGNGGGSFFAGVGAGGNTGANSNSSVPSNSSNGSGNPSGTDSSNGGSVARFTIGGTISGLDADGFVLRNNGGDLLSVASGATTFKFATSLASGAAYNVDVARHPFGEVCLLNGQAGTASADVVSVAIVCGDWVAASAKVDVFAGSIARGVQDGARLAAGFYGPYGLAFGPDGAMFVADSGNNTIRAITPEGVVSTLAGDSSLLNGGHDDGTGTAASFKNPRGVVVDSNGTIYVADYENNMIRKVTPQGVVSVFAGSTVGGNLDGTGASALFQSPWGIVVDAGGNLFVADQGNHLIRKITPAGVVSTFAGTGTPGFVNANGTGAQFHYPTGLAIDAAGNLYVGDQNNNVVRMITPAGDVSTFAGSGTPASVDGTGTAASFNLPIGVATDEGGNVYVTELLSNSVRKISTAGRVTTLAGGSAGGAYVDGSGSDARFNEPMGVAVDRKGDVYIADRSNNMIRRVTRTH